MYVHRFQFCQDSMDLLQNQTPNQELAKEQGQWKKAKLKLEGQVSKLEVYTCIHTVMNCQLTC